MRSKIAIVGIGKSKYFRQVRGQSCNQVPRVEPFALIHWQR